MLFEIGIEGVDGIPNLLELVAGPQHLNAQVVLFVDHDHARLVLADHDTGAGFRVAKLAADQVTLHQNLFLQFIKALNWNRQTALHLRQRRHGLHALVANLAFLRIFCPTGKGMLGQIAREADTGHQHHGAFASRPGKSVSSEWESISSLIFFLHFRRPDGVHSPVSLDAVHRDTARHLL